MHRLFVAIRPPPEVRALLLDLMEGVAGARWQDDEQLHITLRFIGEVDGRVAYDVAAALAQVAQPCFSIALAGIGQFDTRGRPKAIWAGIRPHDMISRLHRKMDQALVRTGLEPERRAYLPHITLARFGRDAGLLDGFLALHAGLSSEPFMVSSFALFESVLSHGGPIYEPLERYPLDPG